MNTPLTIALTAALSLASIALPAAELIDGTNVKTVSNLASGYGSITAGTDSKGAPKLTGRIEGTGYAIYFYDCDDASANCTSIQFAAGWSGYDVSVARINEWNKTKRFGKAYLDDENDPILEMDVNLKGGVSTKNLDDTFDWWATVLKAFKANVLNP